MDPLTISLLAAGVGGGIGNYLANASANERASALQNQAFQQWMDLNIPNPEDQKIVLQKFVNEGQLDPKLQSAIKQDPSAFEKIVTPGGYKSAQNRALSQLEDIGESGGFRLQDEAALQEAMLQSQREGRIGRQNIASEMARRGMSNSGFDVAARLASQQNQANQDAQNSLRIAAMGQERALKAIEDSGQLATQYRGQDFGEQAQKAAAADAISRFNVANLRDVNAANIGAQNQAQQYNLSNAQDISNRNVNAANAQQQYNKQLGQQYFENQARRTAGATGQLNQLAGTEQRQGQNLGNLYGNLGQSALGAAAAKGQYDMMDNYFDNKKNKKIIEES